LGLLVISIAFMPHLRANDELGGAIGQCLFVCNVTLLARLDVRLFDRVSLREPVRMCLRAPGAVEVIEVDLAAGSTRSSATIISLLAFGGGAGTPFIERMSVRS
jgi:hypothetical protein